MSRARTVRRVPQYISGGTPLAPLPTQKAGPRCTPRLPANRAPNHTHRAQRHDSRRCVKARSTQQPCNPPPPCLTRAVSMCASACLCLCARVNVCGPLPLARTAPRTPRVGMAARAPSLAGSHRAAARHAARGGRPPSRDTPNQRQSASASSSDSQSSLFFPAGGHDMLHKPTPGRKCLLQYKYLPRRAWTQRPCTRARAHVRQAGRCDKAGHLAVGAWLLQPRRDVLCVCPMRLEQAHFHHCRTSPPNAQSSQWEQARDCVAGLDASLLLADATGMLLAALGSPVVC